MAFKQVQDLNPETVISLGGSNRKTGKKNPDVIEGYYLGKREVADKKKKTGKSYIYVFQTPKGEVGVWGKTDMDRKMGAATAGTMTRVSFVGMTATPNGEMYKYKVEIDEDNSIEVTGAISASSSDDLDSSEESYETESSEDGPSYQDEDDNQSAALLAAERKAKVQALLNKTGKKA